MRGAEGREKAILVRDFWQNVRSGLLEEWITRTFSSLVNGFVGSPSLYARFTFTVQNVTTELSAGSPKVLFKKKRKKVKAWFVSSGLAYTLEGARAQTEKAIDTIADTVHQAGSDAIFFLDFVTCRAYVVKA